MLQVTCHIPNHAVHALQRRWERGAAARTLMARQFLPCRDAQRRQPTRFGGKPSYNGQSEVRWLLCWLICFS